MTSYCARTILWPGVSSRFWAVASAILVIPSAISWLAMVEARLANVLITLASEMLADAESWHREIQLSMRVSQELLAQLAGTTQPTVSELLKKFQHLGLIRVEHWRITLLSPQKLLDRR